MGLQVTDINNVFRSTLVRALDGDTLRLAVDLRLDVSRQIDIRMRNVWAPEKNTAQGKVVMARVQTWLAPLPFLMIQTFKTSTGSDIMTFTRYVADVWLPDGVFFNEAITQWMVDNGITDPGIGG